MLSLTFNSTCRFCECPMSKPPDDSWRLTLAARVTFGAERHLQHIILNKKSFELTKRW